MLGQKNDKKSLIGVIFNVFKLIPDEFNINREWGVGV